MSKNIHFAFVFFVVFALSSLILPSASHAQEAINVNPSSVKAGKPIIVTISNISSTPSEDETYSLQLYNNFDTNHNSRLDSGEPTIQYHGPLTFVVNSSVGSGEFHCKDPDGYNQAIWGQGGTDPNNDDIAAFFQDPGAEQATCAYHIALQTNGFVCNRDSAGNPTSDQTCSLVLTKNGQQVAMAQFAVSPGQQKQPDQGNQDNQGGPKTFTTGGISFSPIYDPISSTDIIPVLYEDYEGHTTTVTANGCSQTGEVFFQWWQKIDATETCFKDFSCSDTFREDQRTSGNQSNDITLPISVDGDSPNYFYITATCKDKVTTLSPAVFTVRPVGKEFVKFPVEIPSDTEFPIVLGGLLKEHQDTAVKDQRLLCYYFVITPQGGDNNGEPVTPSEGDRNLACADWERDFADNPYYAGSNAWHPSITMNIHGLPFGVYNFKLYRLKYGTNCPVNGCKPDGKNDAEDEIVIDQNFCIASCRNDQSAFPPGRAPCLIGEDKDGNIIDTRPTDTKGGLAGTPGPRDAIVKCTAIPTAFGVLGVDPEAIVSTLLGILLGIVGGIAVLLIIYAGYKMVTSHGNPEQVESARETLTSAIIGLLFIIFSVVILEVIGIDILRIPGFESGNQCIGPQCLSP